MSAVKLATDPLWQCLCPAWTLRLPIIQSTRRIAAQKPCRTLCPIPVTFTRAKSEDRVDAWAKASHYDGMIDFVRRPLSGAAPASDVTAHEWGAKSLVEKRKTRPEKTIVLQSEHAHSNANALDTLREEPTESLYGALRANAIDGKVALCLKIAKMLVEERREKPSHPIYRALILSNIQNADGSAWRVAELLEEMRQDGLQPDSQACHAALKVLSVHLDHLLRTDILEYMTANWIQLSDIGTHDVVAGLLREGLFEQALHRLDRMSETGVQIRPWLLDMAIYILCEANEIPEAYQIMQQRFDSSAHGSIGRSLWSFFLDKASSARHHAATALVWSSQVKQKYINPPSGVCLNVLATAARAADAVMATEVFTHLGNRGTSFQPIHYELLISTYLAADPPDLARALAILSIMAGEKVEPTAIETRPFFLHLRNNPHLLPSALQTLRDLHERDRIIPIAALNVLIECHIENNDLSSALKIYKQIHTFVRLSAGIQKTFANVETFNLLLKGCRLTDPPSVDQASFLRDEMLALGVQPTALTYDRLILVFTAAAELGGTANQEYLDRAFEHFEVMRAENTTPRFGTLEALGVALASVGDARCWDVLQDGAQVDSDVDQSAADRGESMQELRYEGHWIRRKIEEAWERAMFGDLEPADLGGENVEQGDLKPEDLEAENPEPVDDRVRLGIGS